MIAQSVEQATGVEGELSASGVRKYLHDRQMEVWEEQHGNVRKTFL